MAQEFKTSLNWALHIHQPGGQREKTVVLNKDGERFKTEQTVKGHSGEVSFTQLLKKKLVEKFHLLKSYRNANQNYNAVPLHTHIGQNNQH